MIAEWVAVATRGRGLVSRRLGRTGARRLAGAPSLEAALAELIRTPYGPALRAGMDLLAAQQAVLATLAWHLRILAGWAPPRGIKCVRLLAGGLEIANVMRRLATFAGRPSAAPTALGALESRPNLLLGAAGPAAVRAQLAASAWGDPGTEDFADVRAVLETRWARRVARGVPEAAPWAAAYAALAVARALAAGVPLRADSPAAANVRAVLGNSWVGSSLASLGAHLPADAAWVLDGVRTADDLWRAEARWWMRIEADAFRLHAPARASSGAVVGVVGLLSVDAWRTRAALELAARGGGAFDEVFDGVA